MYRIFLDKEISSGAYGNIYIGKDKEGKEYIVKTIPHEADGLSCLTEYILMSSIRYPFLNSALSITCDNTNTYILQEKAERDLCLNQIGTMKERLEHCFNIAQAVLVLHSCDIIHGDIKGSNCFVFLQGDKEIVKLGDFSHSFKAWNNEIAYVSSGTPTHRAPENVSNKECTKAFDIYALGCTFYEIIYGKYYNPYETLKAKEGEEDIVNLLELMVKKDPRERLNIEQVLKHTIFSSFKRVGTYSLITNKGIKGKDDSISGKLKRVVSGLTLSFALNLYPYLINLDIPIEHKLTAIVLISYKLTTHHTLKLSSNIKEVLQAEAKICAYLNFRFNIFCKHI